MFPQEFIQRLQTQPYINKDQLVSHLSLPGPVSIRLNTRKWNKIPLVSEPVQWEPAGYYLKSRPSYTSDPLFHAGCYYPQEASSMFTGELFRRLTSGMSNLRVLDLCGAPGGKSTHLSSLIGSNGVLVANEVIRQRASVLAENLTKWGTGNAIVTNSDPSAFSAMTGYFDLVIVDAPCSGEGMFRDTIAVEEWSTGNTALCAERQRRILADIWPALKPGGYLVYSTCTFNPAENEENIAWMAGRGDCESVETDISGYEGITCIEAKGIKGYGFHPGRIKGDGFFISVLRKISGDENYSLPSQSGFKNVSRKDASFIRNYIDGDPDKLFNKDGFVTLVPVHGKEYEFLARHLRVVKGGTDLFQIKGTDFNPLPDLALSVNIMPGIFPVFDAAYSEAISFLRRDIIHAGNTGKGWFIVRYDGVNLGFAKNIGSRVNNYFPVEWRIRMAAGKEDQASVISWAV